MLFLISPAKALDYETPPQVKTHTQPLFVEQAAELVGVMRAKSPQQVAALMDLSDKLAALNAARYEAWSPKFTAKNSRQAVLAFDGDVYGGLDAKSLSPDELDWLQQHLCILSGLYGVLRPLDRMQPYRLEMGTRLKTARGNSLYAFWGSRIADYLNERAQADKSPVVINLASEEYFKAVDLKALRPRVVTCAFEERKADGYKVISFMAKRARGLMVRWALQQRASTPDQLKGFDLEGYRFEAGPSTPDRLVFRRESKA
ncbi:MAG: peroxide stress protein YaaA [Hydrogenophaga sp.]|nr:peroxide stress protein YaaA [Hydrogenophaga sp.]